MKIITTLAAVLLLFAGPPALASEHAPGTLASIVAEMNHFPDDEQKSKLSDIAEDEDTDEDLRVIAEAISNIEHQASDADKAKLNDILEDESATDAARTLAGAVVRFNHEAADQDAAALEKLAE